MWYQTWRPAGDHEHVAGGRYARRATYSTAGTSITVRVYHSATGAQAAADLLRFGEPATPNTDECRRIDLGSPVGRARGRRADCSCADELRPRADRVGAVGLKVLDDAPNQRDGAPQAWIRFDEQVAEGAKDLRPGDEIVVLTWALKNCTASGDQPEKPMATS